MKITQPPIVPTNLVAKPAASTADGHGAPGSTARFSALLDGGQGPRVAPPNAPKTAALAAGHPLYGLEALLAVQEVGDDRPKRQRAKKRGEELLAALDRIRNGLLLGDLSPAVLRQLTTTINQERSAFLDPRLNEILDEIDLLAQVELAKYS
ncbi:MAG: flagellar assembly protein FliX [Candidatus Pacebacteria bacterium]|nr:flagellar assembly protein FliX [Candidatus Paceibacterota bacterium]